MDRARVLAMCPLAYPFSVGSRPYRGTRCMGLMLRRTGGRPSTGSTKGTPMNDSTASAWERTDNDGCARRIESRSDVHYRSPFREAGRDDGCPTRRPEAGL